MIRSYFRYIIFLLILGSSYSVSAQKDDTLIHINGNVMTGEIKKMIDGILYFKMDGMGTISVEAEKINTFETQKLLQIRTKQGKIIFGRIDTTTSIGYVNVGYGINKENIRVLDIVEIYPIKATFWLRTSGKMDFGIDYAKSTNMLRANTSGRIEYRRKKMSSKFVWDSYVSAQGVDTTIHNTSKADANLSITNLIKGRWLWTGLIGENSNSEMGLDLRLYVGLTIQNDIIYTSRHHLFAQAGFNFNREYPTMGEILENPEGFLSVSYYVYKHARPSISLSTNVDILPNLKFNGRWRLDTNVDLNIEVFHNFYVGFKVYTNFDSKPATENAASTDWGSSFTLGYSFN
jgi:hypothetical protein